MCSFSLGVKIQSGMEWHDMLHGMVYGISCSFQVLSSDRSRERGKAINQSLFPPFPPSENMSVNLHTLLLKLHEVPSRHMLLFFDELKERHEKPVNQCSISRSQIGSHVISRAERRMKSKVLAPYWIMLVVFPASHIMRQQTEEEEPEGASSSFLFSVSPCTVSSSVCQVY